MRTRQGHAGLARRTTVTLGLLASLLVALAGSTSVWAQVPTPEGYTVESAHTLTAGVEYAKLAGRGPGALSVHVARIHPHAAVKLEPVLAGGRVNGGLERTSEMCRRSECLVAVNGDFHHLDTRQPVGGLVADGVMVRSPVATHHQFSFGEGDTMSASTFEWSGRLMASDLRDLTIDAVNVPRTADAVVLYTPAFGPTTATNAHGAELVLRVVEPAGPLRLDQTSLVEATELRHGAGDTAIPADGLVLSGHGAGDAALADLWARMEAAHAGRRALLRLETTTAVVDSIGGSPVLVREARRFVGNDGSSFMAGRHPRTLAGWTAAGEVLLVTVDGRQPGHSVGMSLQDAADLMISLGAVEAINLDGGGSTTFVVAGEVVNRPSDRLVRRGRASRIAHVAGGGDQLVGWVERPVSVALAVVPLDGKLEPAAEPLGPGAGLPSAARDAASAGRAELALPVPGGDPGSDPTGHLPALVAVAPASQQPVWPLALVAAALLGGVAVATPTAARTRASHRRPPHSGPTRRR